MPAIHLRHEYLPLLIGKTSTLARNEVLSIKNLTKNWMYAPQLWSFITGNGDLKFTLQIKILNRPQAAPSGRAEGSCVPPINVYIITDEIIQEFVRGTSCFGIAPVHHKVAFSVSPVESIGDFMDKVRSLLGI